MLSQFAETTVRTEESNQLPPVSQLQRTANCVESSKEKNADVGPCIFEAREKGRCKRGKRCSFNHDIDPEMSGNGEAFQKLLDDVSKELNKCAGGMVDGSCPNMNNGCPHMHKRQKTKIANSRVCFRELMEKGSCPRGENRCKFSHKINEELRTDAGFLEKVRQEKDVRAGKCINEFYQPGSCLKKVCCPFSHTITEQDRKNKDLCKKMQDKRNLIAGKKVETEKMGDKNHDQGIVNIGVSQLVEVFTKVVKMLENQNIHS